MRSAESFGDDAGCKDSPPLAGLRSTIDSDYAWAPGRLPRSSFIFYRLADGLAWVIYSLLDGKPAIVAWPKAEDGWAEALPRTVGKADLRFGIYRGNDFYSVIAFLAPRSLAMCATSDPQDFERFSRPRV